MTLPTILLKIEKKQITWICYGQSNKNFRFYEFIEFQIFYFTDFLFFTEPYGLGIRLG